MAAARRLGVCREAEVDGVIAGVGMEGVGVEGASLLLLLLPSLVLLSSTSAAAAFAIRT